MQYPPYPKTSEGGPPLFPGRRMEGMTVVLITVGALVAFAAVAGLVGLIVFAQVYGKVHEDTRWDKGAAVTTCRTGGEARRPVAGVRIADEAVGRGTYTVSRPRPESRAGPGAPPFGLRCGVSGVE
ncbi:hypothetical protein [Streptomyces sp. NPDC086838]|uniref:hypothetical protein n=1 Tax=Streptomyces sp. NPDC086838 TaxID=3365762 RepID=UPI00381C15F9